jgi:hypothetical protein
VDEVERDVCHIVRRGLGPTAVEADRAPR